MQSVNSGSVVVPDHDRRVFHLLHLALCPRYRSLLSPLLPLPQIGNWPLVVGREEDDGPRHREEVRDGHGLLRVLLRLAEQCAYWQPVVDPYCWNLRLALDDPVDEKH